MTSKERVMKLFKREKIDRMPCFSGQGMVILPAIQACGLKFPQIHKSAENMARSARASMERYGFDGSVVPFDMCTIPEAFGLEISLYENSEEILYPTIPYKWQKPEEVKIPEDFMKRARMPVVSEAISLLCSQVGSEFPIGSWVLGPFTLAGQILELDVLMKMTFKQKQKVEDLLDRLVDVIIQVGQTYSELGADYLSLREMGTGADLLSPRTFKEMIQPRLKRIFEAWPSPKVLHICGSTDLIIEMMNGCGADALSVDQKNTLSVSREKIGDQTLLFGNVDPYKTLCAIEAEAVPAVVKKCIDDGADAVWPGCDIWPDVKEQNLREYVKAVRELGVQPTPAVGRLQGGKEW